ncbi:hypothetical protein DMN91_006834 [Ooceraea biroi]|uniref:KIF-binding protein n=3 Tax=Ooceraea biroi TaxID=2015173 RepID=A0A3L8DII0_OOCBI|nr:hypothetical protein DMN91_006834 [Ooceraea biroi]
MTLYRELLNRLKPIEEILKFDSNVWDAYTLVNIMQKFLMRQSVMVMANPVKTDLAWIHAACQLSASFLRLSKFRLSFTEARNCIASAQYMLELNDKEVSKAETSNNSEDFHDANYYVTKASVALAWCNYSNLILFLSKYNMSYIRLGTGFPIHKAAKSISMSSTTSVKFLILTHLEENLKIIHNYTNQVTDTYYVTTRDDAKSVFLHYIKWFEVTKTCYKKIGFVESTKLIAYNISTTYKYLAYFEPDKDNQIKLLKRQIQILKDICDIDVYKVTLENFLMRRIYCDLAVSYAIIVDMILENMEFNTTYVEEGNLKEYIRNSVKCYKKYIFLLRSYYNKKLV